MALIAVLLTRQCSREAAPLDAHSSRDKNPPEPSRQKSASLPPASAAPGVFPSADEPPFAMRAMTFELDSRGIRLTQAVTASGRVKAPPRSSAAHRIEFEVYDQSGQKIYEGSFDHPLRVNVEHADPAGSGKLHHTEQSAPSGAFQIRLPSTLAGTRLAVFEVQPGASGSTRTELASLPLP